jgi:hypothetical protein
MGACEPTPNRPPGLPTPTTPATTTTQQPTQPVRGPILHALDKARPHGCGNARQWSPSMAVASVRACAQRSENASLHCCPRTNFGSSVERAAYGQSVMARAGVRC